MLVVRLAAPPVEGAANEALIEFLAAAFHVPRRAVQILSGDRDRRKRVAIDGVGHGADPMVADFLIHNTWRS